MLHESHTIDADVRPRTTATYLRVAGDECAFVEAHTSHATPRMLEALRARGRRPEDVRWVVVTHAHLDHAAGAGALLRACPNATLLAHPRAAKNLIDPAKLVKSATHVYGAARFAELFGAIEPVPEERVCALDDGASFELGDARLRVWHTAGHAFHHLVVHDPAIDTVYTGDAFGLVYPDLQRRGRFALPSTSPIGFDAPEAHESIERVLALGARTACPTHFGPYQDLDVIAAQLHEWLARAGAWVNEAARGDETTEAMTERFARAWRAVIENEIARRDLGFGPEKWSALALDIELNAQGLAFAADARRTRVSVPRPA